MIIVALTFIVIFALVLGAYWVFVLRLDQSDDAALQKRLQPERVSSIRSSGMTALMRC